MPPLTLVLQDFCSPCLFLLSDMDKGFWMRIGAESEEFCVAFQEGALPVYPSDTSPNKENRDDKTLSYSKDRFLYIPHAGINWLYSSGVKSKHAGVADFAWRLTKIVDRTWHKVRDIYPSHDDIRNDYDLAELADTLISAAHLKEWESSASHARIWKPEALWVSFFSSKAGFERRPERNVFALSVKTLTAAQGRETTAAILKAARPSAAYKGASRDKPAQKSRGNSAQPPSSTRNSPKPGPKQGSKKSNKKKKSNQSNQGGLVCSYCANSGHLEPDCKIKQRAAALRAKNA